MTVFQCHASSCINVLHPQIKVNAIDPDLIKFNVGDDESYRVKALNKAAIPIGPGEQVVWQTLQFIFDNPYLTGEVIPL